MSKKKKADTAVQREETRKVSPIVVWETKEKQNEANEKLILLPVCNASLEREATVSELIILSESQQSLTKIKVVSSGFGKVKDSVGYQSLSCAA